MFGGTNKMPQKIPRKALILPLLVSLLGLISANQTYDQILQPITTIFNLMKYSVTLIAGLVLVGAGIMYMTGGSDPLKREKAKNMVMYVVIGLAIIWIAPFIVQLMIGN